MSFAARLRPILERVISNAAVLVRPMTLGVRVVATDEAGHILLVRHTYLPGWYLPGGGVDPGETAAAAAARELREEAGLHAKDTPELLGVYLNSRASRRNHVLLYRVRAFERLAHHGRPNAEIAEIRFVDPASPPEGITAATLRRFEELAGRAEVDPHW